MNWHASMSPLISGFLSYLCPESLTHSSPSEGAPCQHVCPPWGIIRFSLGFVTLKTSFIFLLYRFFFSLDCLRPSSPHTVFCLSFFSITPTAPVAAGLGEIQTAARWSAKLPDRREQAERIGSPMPGNLLDNGMWPPNNIHKYSDEAAQEIVWRKPSAACARRNNSSIAVLGWCREEVRISFHCVALFRNSGVVLFVFFFVEVCRILNMNRVELISFFLMV